MLDTVIEVLVIVQDCSSYSLNAYDIPLRMGAYRALLCTFWWPETRAVILLSLSSTPHPSTIYLTDV